MDIFNIRYVVVKNKRYILSDDVANYIRTLAETEETDVRNRLNEAANCIQHDRKF